ncbi:hypothetical protein K5V21_05995 [Clostridium sardiniense]|uniref:YokE-like PH domain-containing protein n=1 Tax=Clostridium sardiniense TaxID=29369 RepID=A0ABS7KW22_CLOSR|nr:hypothetical protein [Clostridium sardiniense]MBY0755005.1 hypothetical protein [Clostridium sardiniense]MDQ0459141.1 hypothetical protein [Clostridium sardiniense]
MSSLIDINLKKNLFELENSLDDSELIKGYFETTNCSAEKERKSPISGGGLFGYLFSDEWIWNTIFVLTNKNLYLINTKENFEKVSLNKIPIESIVSINVFKHNENPIIELKIKGHSKIQYTPLSTKYLDVLKNINKVNIYENQKPKVINTDNLLFSYSIVAVLLLVSIIILYILI